MKRHRPNRPYIYIIYDSVSSLCKNKHFLGPFANRETTSTIMNGYMTAKPGKLLSALKSHPLRYSAVDVFNATEQDIYGWMNGKQQTTIRIDANDCSR